MKSLLHFTLKTMMAMVMGIGLVAFAPGSALAQYTFPDEGPELVFAAPANIPLDVSGVPAGPYASFTITADFTNIFDAWSSEVQLSLVSGATTLYPATAASNGLNDGDPVTLTWSGFLTPSYNGGDPLTLVTSASYSLHESELSNISITINPPVAGYCETPAYSLGDLTCANNFGITNVTFGDLTNPTGCLGVAPYFTFYTSPEANVFIGESVPLSVSLQGITSFATWVKVYIDFNQNESFDDPGELIFNTGNVANTPGPFTTNVTIPSVAAGQYRMRVRSLDADVNSCTGDGIVGEVEDYLINITAPPGCSGTPNAGTASVSPSTPVVCVNSPLTLTAVGITIDTGIDYQWQSSPDGLDPWTDVPGATTPISTFNASAAVGTTSYRMRSLCTNTSDENFTNVVEVETSSASVFCENYCETPLYSLNGATCTNNFGITNVTFGDLNNPSACNQVNPNFTFYTSPQATLFQDTPYTLSVSLQGTTAFITFVKVYIDFNQNGSFDDAGEEIYNSGDVGGVPGPFGDIITIPGTVSAGQYRMRVRSMDADENSCTGDGIVGEVEDYIIEVVELTACSAIPTPGNTESTAGVVCSDELFTLSLENITLESGLTYQWQTSPDNSTWTNAGPDAATWETSQTEDTYYQCIVTCDGEGSATSTSILVEVDTPGNCPCIPLYEFGKTDGDLISVVEIIGTTLFNDTGTDPVNPSYTYFTGEPNYTADLLAGTDYEISISVGTFSGQNIAVWIDFDEDGIFDISERVGFTTTSIAANGTGSFILTLPCDAPPGVKRMRVRDVWNEPANLIDPCAEYGFGETEDYDVNIVALDACESPQVTVTGFTDTTIDVDRLESSGCFDPILYESFTIDWGTGSESGITSLPYTIEGLTPGTNYTIQLSAVCTGPISSGATTVSQTTLNCTTEEVCSYTLTLANSSGTGFDGAFVQVNNGWLLADYTLGATEEENTFIIDACPGNPLTVNLNNGGEGALGGAYSVSLVNSSDVEVYGESGPDEGLLFFTEDGCPDCASANNVSPTRLASDLVEVTWSNVELVGNVNDILVEVFGEDFLGEPTVLYGSTTVAAGSTSASVVLDAEYPLESVVVRVSTNCTNDAISATNLSVVLPSCAAAAQCEYVFDMTSAADGWGDFGFDILLGDFIDFTLALETGTSGTQSVFACEDENLVATANNPGGTPAGCLVAVNGEWGGPLNPVCGGGPASVTDAWTSEYSQVNVVAGNEYTFSSTNNDNAAPNFITVSNAAGTVALAAGTSPITWYAESSGTVRFYSHNEGPDACTGDTGPFRTRSVSCVSAPAPVSCSSIGFDLTLNPATDNVELIATTDFCGYEDGETVFSGTACPSCFAATGVEAINATTNSVDVTWNSPNPAGTDYTVYVGLPGFTPGVDEVSSATGTTGATGAQGPETVGGLDLDTEYEVIIIEDCGAEQADASLPVSFSTLPPSPCPDFEVPVGATAEGEPCGDDTNGGCNSPNPAFGTIDCGETVVGNGWADGATRDTDWYQFVSTTGGEIDIIASAEFPFVVGVIFDFEDCADISTFDLFVVGDACTEINLNGIVGPGIHSVFVGHQNFEGTPCGINANSYWVTLDADICTPIVEPDNNECAEAQSLSVPEWPTNNFTLGTLQGATASPTGPFCEGLATRDVFYSFTAATDNHYFVNINPIAGTDFTVELYDECDGELVECMSFSSEIGGCGADQGSPGFSADPGCEAAVCAFDNFCCNVSWDAICGDIAVTEAACSDCLEFIPSPAELVLDLPAGDYILRVGSALGLPLLGAESQFLIGVQSFPTAQVQDDPDNFLFACNQTVQLEDIIGATPQSGQLPGVLDYEWFIAEEGGTFQNFWVRGGPNYATLPQWLDMEYAGITYNVFVRLLIDVPGVGPTWGVFQQLNPDPHAVGASVCTITTSNDITLTELRPNYVGTNAQGNPYAMCDIAIAQTVAEAEAYEWWFSSIAGDVFYVRNAPNPSVKLSWVDCLQPNSFYDVRVRAQVGGDWADFGPVQTIETGPTALTQLRNSLCGDDVQLTTWLLPTSVCISDSHTWELENTVTNDIHTFVSINPSGAARVNQFVPPVVPGQEYIVRVKATQCTVEGDFSGECNITIAGPGAEEQGTPLLRDLATNGSSLYPNPNAGSEVRLELQGIGDGAHDVHVVIYDIYGKMINTNNFGHEGTDLSRLIRFDENLAMGMYMVHVLIDGEQFAVERMVVK